MSTLTHAAPTTLNDTPRARIVSGRLVLVFGCSLGTLTSFYLMLSVTPLFATAAGAGSAGAGLVTGVLMLAGVAAEFAAPSLMNRLGNAPVLALGLAMLG